jgi:hypothetical protein
MKQLGKLRRVTVREVWRHEASDFTPWLAQEANIALLSAAVRLDLIVEAQEKNVGPFRADILCKDTLTNAWVLIENQLERTDHAHLGQLLTYAAGLQAATIIWIAERFTEEHRAALDWLNEITDERFAFFGIEIELWQIESSPLAPNFKLVSMPNDWSKQIASATAQLQMNNLTLTRQLYLAYWTSFNQLLREYNGLFRARKPSPDSWTDFAIGHGSFGLQAVLSARDGWIAVVLLMRGPHAKSYFRLLSQHRAEVEQAVGAGLDWRELPNNKESQAWLFRRDLDLTNRESWPEQQRWLMDTLETFYRVFAPLVKELNAT